MGTRYFVVKEQAVPEVLLKVVEAKKLLETGRVQTVNEAADFERMQRLGVDAVITNYIERG